MSRTPSYAAFFKSWRKRKLIFPLCVGASLFLCVFILNIITPRYTVVAVVGPTARDGAAAQGIRLPLQSISDEMIRPGVVERSDDETLSDFSRFMQLLMSPEIAAELLKDKSLGAERLLKSGFIDSLTRALAGQSSGKKGADALAQSLKSHLVVNGIGRSAMREIIWRDTDRDFGIKLVNAILAAADRHLKDQARTRTALEIVYLKHALESVTLSEHRRALAELLAVQERTQMMLVVDLPFASDVIQSASAPNAPDWPPASLCFLIALVAGVFAATSIHYYKAIK